MKNLNEFLNESLTQGQLVDLVHKLPNDAQDIYEPLESILSWNEDDVNNILLSMDNTKSIDNTKSFLEAIEENKWWKDLCDWVNDEDEDIKMTQSKLKSLIKKYDKELTEIFLNMFEEGIKELKSYIKGSFEATFLFFYNGY